MGNWLNKKAEEDSKKHDIIVEFSDGDTVHTSINGTKEKILRHYRTNNRMSGKEEPKATYVTIEDEGRYKIA